MWLNTGVSIFYMTKDIAFVAELPSAEVCDAFPCAYSHSVAVRSIDVRIGYHNEYKQDNFAWWY